MLVDLCQVVVARAELFLSVCPRVCYSRSSISQPLQVPSALFAMIKGVHTALVRREDADLVAIIGGVCLWLAERFH